MSSIRPGLLRAGTGTPSIVSRAVTRAARLIAVMTAGPAGQATGDLVNAAGAPSVEMLCGQAAGSWLAVIHCKRPAASCSAKTNKHPPSGASAAPRAEPSARARPASSSPPGDLPHPASFTREMLSPCVPPSISAQIALCEFASPGEAAP